MGAMKYCTGAPELREVLAEDSSRSVRAVSAWALSQFPATQENWNALLAAFQDDDDWVATEAIWAIEGLAPFCAAAALTAKWAECGADTDQGYAAWAATNTLTRVHTQDECEEALREDDPSVRFGGAWCLADSGDRAARGMLADFMTHGAAEIRAGAMGVFAETDWHAEVQYILDGLQDEDPLVRALAAKASHRHSIEEAIPLLQALLSDSDGLVVYNAIMALKHMPDISSLSLLEEAKNDERKVCRRHTNAAAAEEAIEWIRRRT